MTEHRGMAVRAGTPVWVRAFGVLAATLAAFVLVAIITGGEGMHGPARHAAGSGAELGFIALLTVLLGAAAMLNGFMPTGRADCAARLLMPPRLRKLALVAHVVASVGFLGAVASFLVLAITGLTTQEESTARAVYLAMKPITRAVIVPLCMSALITGLLQALGTPWGLFRHYWVLVKLLLTLLTTIVLLMQIRHIIDVADAAQQPALSLEGLRLQRVSLVTHAAGGLIVLITATVLSIFKPGGLTPRGLRATKP